MFDRRSNIEPPHRQTCSWILTSDEYIRWQSQPSGLLWIKGKPGAGKSTLMSFLYNNICHERSIEKIYLDFFFSARGSELQRTPLGMVRSLLNQIFRQNHSVQHLIQEVYDEKCAAFGYGHYDWHWQQRELEILLTKAIIALAQTKPVEIFIDALDEAGEQSAREMARYFYEMNDRLSDSSTGVKICISCRHYPVVSRSSAIELCVEDHNSNDISAFVQDRLHIYERHVSNVPALSRLASDLVARSRGVFQWVTLILLMVEKSIDDGEPLEAIRAGLEFVPQELSDVYRYILQNIIDMKYRAKAFSLFQWVCLAKRPLSIMELHDALIAQDTIATMSPTTSRHMHDCVDRYNISPTSIRAWSGGLLEVTSGQPQRGSVQVIHQTVNDFLLSQGLILLNKLVGVGTIKNTIFVSREDTTSQDLVHHCEGTIYRACLNYFMSQEVKKLIPQLCYPDSGAETHIVTTREKNVAMLLKCPLLDYVVKFIFLHAESANGYRGMDIYDEIQMLDHNLPDWVHTYQILSPSSSEYILLILDPSRVARLSTASAGRTTLHIAAIINSSDMIEYLIQNGIDIDAVDKDGYAAMHFAAQRGHLSCIKVLSAAGANIDTITRRGVTPLVLAASEGHTDVVRWFLEKGACLNNRHKSALCAAAASGSTLMVQILIDAGAEINAQVLEYGIAQASSKGYESTVRLLLKHEVAANACEKYGEALVLASRGGHDSTVRLLLEHGADVNGDGYLDALSNASEKGHESTVRLLLERVTNIDSFGYALSLASQNGHESIACLLIEHGADIDKPCGYESPVALAAWQGQESLVSLLIKNGADLNDMFDGRQSSALEMATRKQHSAVIRLLREAGAKALYR